MQDLKYLSIDDLERFIVNLREEIVHLKASIERDSRYINQILIKRTLEDSESMLVHAEAEILERTLLSKS